MDEIKDVVTLRVVEEIEYEVHGETDSVEETMVEFLRDPMAHFKGITERHVTVLTDHGEEPADGEAIRRAEDRS